MTKALMLRIIFWGTFVLILLIGQILFEALT